MLLKKLTEKKIVIVTRETRADDLRRRFNSTAQAAFYVKKRGGNFSDYLAEDKRYKASVGSLEDSILEWGHIQFIDRAFVPNYVFGPEDTVIVLGQDGLVANTLKYLRDGQPLIGVNPDPDRWDGVLLPFTVDDLPAIVPEVLADRHQEREVTFAEASLNDGQTLLAVNDFFIGQRTHTSARYLIEIGGRKERHSSSGVIVSTGLGSTGWLKSLLRGATAITGEIAKEAVAVSPETGSLSWDTKRLYFTVREPFPSQTTQTNLVFGPIDPGAPLKIRSLMPENGVLFSDGVEADFLEFNSGAETTIGVSETRGHLVVG